MVHWSSAKVQMQFNEQTVAFPANNAWIGYLYAGYPSNMQKSELTPQNTQGLS